MPDDLTTREGADAGVLRLDEEKRIDHEIVYGQGDLQFLCDLNDFLSHEIKEHAKELARKEPRRPDGRIRVTRAHLAEGYAIALKRLQSSTFEQAEALVSEWIESRS